MTVVDLNAYRPIEEGGNGGIVYGGHASQKAAPRYETMPPDELASAIQTLEVNAAAILDQLEQDSAEGYTRGERWRRAAGKALSYQRAFLALARRASENRKPVVPQAPMEDPAVAEQRHRHTMERLEAERRLLEEKRLTAEANKAMNEAQVEARKSLEATLRALKPIHKTINTKSDVRRLAFLRGAMRGLLSAEVVAELWQEARRLAPEDHCWKPMPSMKAVVDQGLDAYHPDALRAAISEKEDV